jgi:hypothetical protein
MAKSKEPATIRWAIVDRHTRVQVGALYTSKSRARARADKLDNEYGAYRYAVVAEDRLALYVGEGS